MRRTVVRAQAGIVGSAILLAGCGTSPTRPITLLQRIDHLVFATPDLDQGVAEIEMLLGVRPTPGGQHPGRGTRNALVSLGPGIYLEIIAPDPTQPTPDSPRWFGLDTLRESKLVTWAANATALDSLRRDAANKGILLGSVQSGSRSRPDGVVLSWRVTDPSVMMFDGVIPFFINWATSTHPSATSAQGAKLIALRAEHPNSRVVQQTLNRLGLDIKVRQAGTAAVVAIIAGPRGQVELR
jgi:hypothetical protein